MTKDVSRSRSRALLKAVGTLAALLLLALLSQPWWLAPLAGHLLSSSARRPVHFDSMWVSLASTLAPAVHFRGIRIDNAPWADASRPFAVLGEADAVFSWRSVRERRPVIALLTLRGGEVDLERRADGLRNWRLGRPDDRGPGRYKVLAIRGEDATVRFRHERLELDLEAKATADRAAETVTGDREASVARTDDEAMPTRLAIRGTWRGAPFAIDATTSEVLTFVETGRTFRVRGTVDSGGARLRVDGRLGDIVHDPLVDARVALVAPSLAPFAALLGGHGGDVKITVEGDAKGEPGRYSLVVAKARVGATDLAGEIGWQRGDERDRIRAALTSESTHLADLRALAGRRPTQAIERAAVTAASGPASAAAAASAPASAPTAAASRSRPLDAQLSYVARRLHGDGLPWLQSAKVEATLADGRLAVSHFDVGIGSGHAVGKADVEVASRPPRGDIDVEVSAIKIESMLPSSAAKAQLSGTLSGRVALKASGESIDAWLASAAGTVSGFVSGGTISSLLDAEMGLQGGRIVRSLLSRRRADGRALRRRGARGRARQRPAAHAGRRQRANANDRQRHDRPRQGNDRRRPHAGGQAAGALHPRSLDPPVRTAAPAASRAGRAGRADERAGARLPRRATLTRAPSGASACSCRTGSRSGRPRSRPCDCGCRAPG